MAEETRQIGVHERLARLEEQNKNQTTILERIDQKMDVRMEQHIKLDKRVTRLEGHLGWLKAIWLAVQATVIGWLSLK